MFNLTNAIKDVIGSRDVSNYAKFGFLMYAVSIGQEALNESTDGITCRVISNAKTYLKTVGEVEVADRNSVITKAMKIIHARAVEGWLSSEGAPNIKDLPWPKDRMVVNEKTGVETRKRGLQVQMSFMSFTAPELDVEPTAKLIVAGQGWKSTVSDIAKLWTLTDTETVLAIENSGELKQAIKDATPEPEAEKEEKVENDQTALYAAFAEALVGFDLTGNTLTTEQLMNFTDGLVQAFNNADALPLPKKEVATS